MSYSVNIRKYIDYLDLDSGQFHRGNCPACGGSNTFTATNNMGEIQYNCYKLDCKVKGLYYKDLSAAEIQELMRKRPAPVKTEPETMEIPEYVVQPTVEHDKFQRFVKRWGIPSYGLLYDVKDERVVFPIYYKGRIIDANGRAVGGKIPKWYRYTGEASYYITGKGSTLLLVEDVVSAMIAALEVPDISVMAILGTSLTDKHIAKIGEYDKIIVALDPDAWMKGIEFTKQIQSWTGLDTKALRLHDDIKYRVDEDIENLIKMRDTI
jgi:hypothetical protein